jgi:hypothetical protein
MSAVGTSKEVSFADLYNKYEYCKDGDWVVVRGMMKGHLVHKVYEPKSPGLYHRIVVGFSSDSNSLFYRSPVSRRESGSVPAQYRWPTFSKKDYERISSIKIFRAERPEEIAFIQKQMQSLFELVEKVKKQEPIFLFAQSNCRFALKKVS